LKALDACSLKSVDKGHMYGLYNHFLHYSVRVSASRQEYITGMPATMVLQTRSAFEIDPS